VLNPAPVQQNAESPSIMGMSPNDLAEMARDQVEAQARNQAPSESDGSFMPMSFSEFNAVAESGLEADFSVRRANLETADRVHNENSLLASSDNYMEFRFDDFEGVEFQVNTVDDGPKGGLRVYNANGRLITKLSHNADGISIIGSAIAEVTDTAGNTEYTRMPQIQVGSIQGFVHPAYLEEVVTTGAPSEQGTLPMVDLNQIIEIVGEDGVSLSELRGIVYGENDQAEQPAANPTPDEEEGFWSGAWNSTTETVGSWTDSAFDLIGFGDEEGSAAVEPEPTPEPEPVEPEPEPNPEVEEEGFWSGAWNTTTETVGSWSNSTLNFFGYGDESEKSLDNKVNATVTLSENAEEGLRFYTEDGLRHRSIPNGASEVKLLDSELSADKFIKVEYRDTVGYVDKNSLTINAPEVTPLMLNATVSLSENAEEGLRFYTEDGLRHRSIPNGSAGVQIIELPQPGTNRVKIQYNGNIGFVDIASLQF
jgi:hypothetical protein